MFDVLVTGIGPVSSIGIGRDAWREGLAAGRSGIAPSSLFTAEQQTAEVRDLHLDMILPSTKTYLDRSSEFTLAAVALALQDAGFIVETTERRQVGIVLGSEYGCLGTMRIYADALRQKGARLANPLLFSHMYVNTPTSLAAIEFGLGGHHGTFAGKGAGQQALEAASEALALKRAEVIIAVGVDALSEPLYVALAAQNALGTDAEGEGACAVVLESAEHAANRGAGGRPLGDITLDITALRPWLGRTSPPNRSSRWRWRR